MLVFKIPVKYEIIFRLGFHVHIDGLKSVRVPHAEDSLTKMKAAYFFLPLILFNSLLLSNDFFYLVQYMTHMLLQQD